jgi:hypothetical protein
MTPMIEHIQSMLERYGFDPNLPQYLSGWSGGWAGPLGADYPPGRYASHLVYNVIDHLNPGGAPGPIAQANYYTWNLESGVHIGTSLVRTLHAEISWGPAASDANCLRPAYVAFVAMKQMSAGEVLAQLETRPELARSMAVAGEDSLRVLLVNYTDAPQTAWVSIRNLAETALPDEAMVRHVPETEICGDGNWFPVDDLAALFVNEPAHLVMDESGAVSGPVILDVNGVALLDIPLQSSGN